jgi:hypothetical protein
MKGGDDQTEQLQHRVLGWVWSLVHTNCAASPFSGKTECSKTAVVGDERQAAQLL